MSTTAAFGFGRCRLADTEEPGSELGRELAESVDRVAVEGRVPADRVGELGRCSGKLSSTLGVGIRNRLTRALDRIRRARGPRRVDELDELGQREHALGRRVAVDDGCRQMRSLETDYEVRLAQVLAGKRS
jgi:hypothetical protein